MKISYSQYSCPAFATVSTITILLLTTLHIDSSHGFTTNSRHVAQLQQDHQQPSPLFPTKQVTTRNSLIGSTPSSCRYRHCYRHKDHFLRYKNNEDVDNNGNVILTRPYLEDNENNFYNLIIDPNSSSLLSSKSRILDEKSDALVNIQDIASTLEATSSQEHTEIKSSSTRKTGSKSTMETMKEILALGLPSLGSCLVDPVMSLVDTACVGQVSTIQLASLAPCTSICQFLFFSFFFLSAATTTFVAANPRSTEAAKAEDADFKAERIVSSASALSLVLGVVVASILFAFTDKLLLLAGCSSTEMLLSARKYLRIRAIGLPAVFFTMVIQGASLGRQDAYTPLKVFSAAGIVNLVGDAVLTLGLGWGVTGAAIATTASQCLAAAYFAYRSIRQGRRRPSTKEEKAVSQEEESAFVSPVALVWRGLPDRKVGKAFAVMAVTLMLKQIVNMTSFSLMTRKAATMGPLALAAHLVTLQVFWMLSFVPEPIGMALQSLVARDRNNDKKSTDDEQLARNQQKQDQPDRTDDGSVTPRIRKLVRTGFLMSSVTGVLIAGITGFCLTCPTIAKSLVQDASVREIMVKVAPVAMLAQAICPLSCIADAACLGLNDIRHLPLSTIGSTIALIFGLSSIKNMGKVAAVGGMIRGGAIGQRGIFGSLMGGGGVETIWMSLVVYFCVRALGNLFLSQKLKNLLFSNSEAA